MFPFVVGDSTGLDAPQAPNAAGTFFSCTESPALVRGGKSVGCKDTGVEPAPIPEGRLTGCLGE